MLGFCDLGRAVEEEPYQNITSIWSELLKLGQDTLKREFRLLKTKEKETIIKGLHKAGITIKALKRNLGAKTVEECL